MVPRRTVALPTAALVVALALATGAAAAPPPQDVCGACGESFESAAGEAGAPVTVVSSSLDVHVRANGSAHVVVENELAGDGAQRVANHSDAVLAVLAERDDGLAPVPENATLSVDESRVRITHLDPDFGHASFGGVVLADAVHDARTGWAVDTDAFRLHAPDGYTITAGASSDVLSRASGEYLDDDYVAFAPDSGVVSTVATELAIGVEVLPGFLAASGVVLAVPVVALAVLLRAFGAFVDRAGTPEDTERVGTALAAAGALVAVVAVAAGLADTSFSLVGATALFAALTAVVVGGLAATGRLDGARVLTAAAVGTPLALGVAAAGVGAALHPGVATMTAARALSAGLLAAHGWAFAVVGATRTERGGWTDVATAVAPFVTVIAPLGGIVALLGPTSLLWFLVFGWIPLLAVFGLPTYWLGAALAAE
ncbi:uncharacterized protein HHUB_1770 [Halobacterium hubeiense]|uniref:Uncharacterized protein n=1 Tax=Halobacterium hubeiense TaxID=1407499 RepID=A0A0U5CWL4_9EURY|nr:hypothetical protein [Halobacterium hubeiense]CQH51756.1 uncharacterized protein HHUB_1770 [Halobacterium hubeiense]